MIGISLAVFAYWFEPSPDIDLSRYFSVLDYMQHYSWEDFKEYTLFKDILIIEDFLFYFIAKSGNFHLLPALVVFVTYSIALYIITDFANRRKVDSFELLKVILIVLCIMPFANIVSNVRNIMAFSIFSLALYREMEQGKKNVATYFLYAVPVLIHISTVALIALRLVLPFYRQKRAILLFASAVVFFQFIEPIERAASKIPVLGAVISPFLIKANSYIHPEPSDYINYLRGSLFMLLQRGYFVCTTLFLFLLLVLAKYYRNKMKPAIIDQTENRRLEHFFELMCFVVIGCAPFVLPVYMRFAYVVMIFAFVPLMGKWKFVRPKFVQQLAGPILLLIMIGGLLEQLLYLNELTDIVNMVHSAATRTLFNAFLPM